MTGTPNAFNTPPPDNGLSFSEAVEAGKDVPVEGGEQPEGKLLVPPIIINHPEDGNLTIGRERDDDVLRHRDVGLYAGSSASLRLFHDGGFELKSSEDKDAIKGCNILQNCDDAPLIIKSKGDIIFEADGRFSVVANDIRMKAINADEGDITLKAKHDINIDANNRAIMQAENVVLDAKDRLVSHSEGWQILIGEVVRLHEPKSMLIPGRLGRYIREQIKELKG
tara:strand:+ start:2028 stop:2699 length:672 start_codon:yes stop_codon:yes gene_type:complete